MINVLCFYFTGSEAAMQLPSKTKVSRDNLLQAVDIYEAEMRQILRSLPDLRKKLKRATTAKEYGADCRGLSTRVNAVTENLVMIITREAGMELKIGAQTPTPWKRYGKGEGLGKSKPETDADKKYYLCPALDCEFARGSWEGVMTHINAVHTGILYGPCACTFATSSWGSFTNHRSKCEAFAKTSGVKREVEEAGFLVPPPSAKKSSP